MRTIEVMTATFETPHGPIKVSGHTKLHRAESWGLASGGSGPAHWVSDVSEYGTFRGLVDQLFSVVWPSPGETMATLIGFTFPFFRAQATVNRVLITDESRPDTEGEKAC